jgi:flagellar hook assembly protein FlgD
VWNGKNSNGRYVGPGTYLVRVTGRDEEGNNFSMQRKIGVTK